MSDIELPDLPPLKTAAWQITNDDISYWTAVRDRSAASAVKDEHELAGFPDSTMAPLVLRSDAEAAILADREKRAQAAQPFDQVVRALAGLLEQVEKFVSEHGEADFETAEALAAVEAAVAFEASKPVQADRDPVFPGGPGDDDEPVQAEAPRLSVEEVMKTVVIGTPHEDFKLTPCALCNGRGFYGTPGQTCDFCKGRKTLATKQAEAPTASNAGERSIRTWSDRAKEQHPNSEPEYWPKRLKIKYMEAEILELRAALAQVPEQVAHTYASTQATNCAGCGERKHTPLRVDAMGGYVCLTCIDRKLGTLLGEFGYPEVPEQVAGDANKVMAYLDGLSDDAAAHIYPSDLERCSNSECVVEVFSVRAGNGIERTVPLFSRDQIVDALVAARTSGEANHG